MKRLTMIVASVLFGVTVAAQTWTGSISDSACGARHMAGMAARECTEACVKQGSSHVLVSQRRVYKLEDPGKVVAPHAGHTVNLTGEIKGDTITVTKVEMPARGKA
ncbi:MAG: hypothetical protein WBD07_03605 [Vicinamibacterales bacterium]